MPLTAVCSGPRITREQAIKALVAIGFILDDRQGEHHWGHPSYRNHGEAAAAGKPNAGHTPNTPHPLTGQDYEADAKVSFATMLSGADSADHSDLLGSAGRVLERMGWVLRSHWAKELNVLNPAEQFALQGLASRLGMN